MYEYEFCPPYPRSEEEARLSPQIGDLWRDSMWDTAEVVSVSPELAIQWLTFRCSPFVCTEINPTWSFVGVAPHIPHPVREVDAVGEWVTDAEWQHFLANLEAETGINRALASRVEEVWRELQGAFGSRLPLPQVGGDVDQVTLAWTRRTMHLGVEVYPEKPNEWWFVPDSTDPRFVRGYADEKSLLTPQSLGYFQAFCYGDCEGPGLRADNDDSPPRLPIWQTMFAPVQGAWR